LLDKAQQHLDKATREFKEDGFQFWGFVFKQAVGEEDADEFMVVGGKDAVDTNVIVDNTMLALMLLTGTSNKQELAEYISKPQVKIYHA
jgi:hypothetical protein